jgi:ethanolamine ammonia-lyase small subunit
VPDSNTLREATPVRTSARLSLGSSNIAVSTQEHLRFQLDHALARDAVQMPLDHALLTHDLRTRGLTPVLLNSAATTRAVYLRRPDLGRKLHAQSLSALNDVSSQSERTGEKRPVLESPRLLILLADGLSSLALEHHALPLLDALLPLIPAPYPLIPVLQNARVAIGDEVGSLLHADLTLLLIGERPGLSSPDSLGAYITYAPQPGRTDAERNCISNIRAEGLGYNQAAHRIAHYVDQSLKLRTTGIALKDPEKISQLDKGV